MSVCTGAFLLAKTGLLDGLTATTHHAFYDQFEKQFPAVHLVRGPRYVEHKKLATAGGLTSGFELALRVVQRYFGDSIARQTAYYTWNTTDHSNVRTAFDSGRLRHQELASHACIDGFGVALASARGRCEGSGRGVCSECCHDATERAAGEIIANRPT